MKFVICLDVLAFSGHYIFVDIEIDREKGTYLELHLEAEN